MSKSNSSKYKMQYVLDSNKNKIHLNEADKEVTYYCYDCGGEVFKKTSKDLNDFFCHKNLNYCISHSNNREMSFWHLIFRIFFNKNECEYRCLIDDELHIADINSGNVVIELQHSNVSIKEFNSRNSAYRKKEQVVIWIFDITGRNSKQECPKDMNYKIPQPCLEGYDFDKQRENGVYIYFHFSNYILNDKFFLISSHKFNDKNKFYHEKPVKLIDVLSYHKIYRSSRLTDLFLHCDKATLKCLNISDDKLYYISNIKTPKVTDKESGKDVTDEMKINKFDACWEIKGIIH